MTHFHDTECITRIVCLILDGASELEKDKPETEVYTYCHIIKWMH